MREMYFRVLWLLKLNVNNVHVHSAVKEVIHSGCLGTNKSQYTASYMTYTQTLVATSSNKLCLSWEQWCPAHQ